MKEKELKKAINEFTVWLLKKTKCYHAGNCYAMCQVLKPYLSVLYGLDTFINNCKVKQGKRKINHYYLFRNDNGMIIDATSSQFIYPNGKQMPKIYIGKKPDFYI